MTDKEDENITQDTQLENFLRLRNRLSYISNFSIKSKGLNLFPYRQILVWEVTGIDREEHNGIAIFNLKFSVLIMNRVDRKNSITVEF